MQFNFIIHLVRGKDLVTVWMLINNFPSNAYGWQCSLLSSIHPSPFLAPLVCVFSITRRKYIRLFSDCHNVLLLCVSDFFFSTMLLHFYVLVQCLSSFIRHQNAAVTGLCLKAGHVIPPALFSFQEITFSLWGLLHFILGYFFLFLWRISWYFYKTTTKTADRAMAWVHFATLM